MPVRYTYTALGSNSRLDALQCAYLNIKLKHLKSWNQRRAEIAKIYISELKSLESKGLVLPVTGEGNEHVYHQFVIQVPNRDSVKTKMAEFGVPTDIYYPKPIPDEDVLKSFRSPSDKFPVASAAAKSVLALPIFPELTQSEIQMVIDGVKKAI